MKKKKIYFPRNYYTVRLQNNIYRFQGLQRIETADNYRPTKRIKKSINHWSSQDAHGDYGGATEISSSGWQDSDSHIQ